MATAPTTVPDTPWYHQLHWRIAVAMLLGIIAGLAGGEPLAGAVGWLGQLFIRLLRMIIVPLVLTSIVTGVASVAAGAGLTRLFSKTFGYYLLTSAFACTIGLVLVNVIRPGVGADLAGAETRSLPDLAVSTSPIDLILDVVPPNVVAAAADGSMLSVIFFAIVLASASACCSRATASRW